MECRLSTCTQRACDSKCPDVRHRQRTRTYRSPLCQVTSKAGSLTGPTLVRRVRSATMPIRIPDQALQLLLLDAAWQEGLLPPFDKIAFYRDELGIKWDFDADYSLQADPRVLSALLATALEDTVLARITAFDWDGSNQVCSHIWSQWDGEDDMFDVEKLDGIE